MKKLKLPDIQILIDYNISDDSIEAAINMPFRNFARQFFTENEYLFNQFSKHIETLIEDAGFIILDSGESNRIYNNRSSLSHYTWCYPEGLDESYAIKIVIEIRLSDHPPKLHRDKTTGKLVHTDRQKFDTKQLAKVSNRSRTISKFDRIIPEQIFVNRLAVITYEGAEIEVKKQLATIRKRADEYLKTGKWPNNTN